MDWPEQVKHLLAKLEDAGFEAWTVGGCVRDSHMGRAPYDWDICTNALPAQIRQVFCGQKTVLTGEKHGTICLLYTSGRYLSSSLAPAG